MSNSHINHNNKSRYDFKERRAYAQVKNRKGSTPRPEDFGKPKTGEEIRMAKQGKKIFIRTFGGQMNKADSEVMERLLEREGYSKIDSPEGAM